MIGSLLGGLFHLPLRHKVKVSGATGEYTNHLDLYSFCPVNMNDGTYFAAYCQQNVFFRFE